MKAWFERFSTTNDNHDEELSYLRLLRAILAVCGIGVLALIVALLLTQPPNQIALLLLTGMELAIVASFVLSTRKIYWPAKFFIPLATIGLITFLTSISNGMHDTAMAGFPVAIVIGGLILGKPGIPLVTIMTLIGVAIVAYRDMSGINASFMAVKTGLDDLLIFSIAQIIIAGSLSALMTRLNRSLQKSQENARAQQEANEELRQLQASLEEQVAQRTLELEQRTHELSERTTQLELANIRIQRRAAQLQALSDTSRAIANVRNLGDLLPRIVNVVSERFNFYHVGIFLTDESNQYAILSAASSDGGKRMLARGHRLEVGTQGIVGYVIGTGLPRVVLNTGADTVFFNNPDLPETRSEMAIPLVVNNRVIGALDIQSKQSNAFSQDDIEVLSTLAEQISIAIETARLFESSQKSLAEMETVSREYAQSAWNQLISSGQVIGFRYTMSGAQPLQSSELAETPRLAADGEPLARTGEQATLTVPIKVRDETIGALNIRVPNKDLWKQDELAIVQAIAERVAISAENARLYQESQIRAEKERLISRISEKLSTSVNLENIFRTALQELGQLVPGSEVFVAFETDQTD
ncbi:MAG: hypothetical protein DDG60_12035 [Anaerolineae bacterium]|nr:MAG: hypothetical protein DDG60_12035 [Anaerolineae bacterium]